MAALPYIQMYPADYLADTMHLTTEEHGAYFLLILNYWQTAKPIAKERLSRIARLTNDRWILVEASLSEFFNDTGTHWVHKRIEADLIMVNEAQEQRSKAGKASAEARKNKKREAEKALNKGSLTPVEIPLNGNSTNKDTDKKQIQIQIQNKKQLQKPQEVYCFPLKGGKNWIATDEMISEWKTTYPLIDIENEFIEIRQWCLDNPTKQKTKSGARRFVGSWLSRTSKQGKQNEKRTRLSPQDEFKQRSGFDMHAI